MKNALIFPQVPAKLPASSTVNGAKRAAFFSPSGPDVANLPLEPKTANLPAKLPANRRERVGSSSARVCPNFGCLLCWMYV
jgi:hypothetical protein